MWNFSREGDDGVKRGATRKKEKEGMLEESPILKEQGMRAQGVLQKQKESCRNTVRFMGEVKENS